MQNNAHNVNTVKNVNIVCIIVSKKDYAFSLCSLPEVSQVINTAKNTATLAARRRIIAATERIMLIKGVNIVNANNVKNAIAIAVEVKVICLLFMFLASFFCSSRSVLLCMLLIVVELRKCVNS